MSILWNYVSALTDTSAKAVAKVGYDYGSTEPQLKVFTLTYNGSTMKLYVDNELVGESTKVEAGMAAYQTLYIGADYDDTCWFKGLMPELIFYNQALSDLDRENLTNYLKSKWVGGTPVVEPTITSGAPFLKFNENSLVKDGNNRVTSWNSQVNARTMTLKTGTTLGITLVNGKEALTFDNRTFFTLPPLAGAANNPDFLTLVFVALFEDFDNTPYPDGDGSQSLISSTNNTQIRIKKFDSDNYLSYRVQDWDGRNYYLEAPKDKVVQSSMVAQDVGTVTLNINNQTYSKTVDNVTDFGTALFDLTGLSPNTTYTGVYSLNGVPQPDTTFSFKTLSQGPSSFKIVTGSCNRTGSNASVWDKIKEEQADLFFHLGDLNYLDLNSYNKQDYSEGLDLSFSTKIKEVLRQTPWVYQYDNHDSLKPTPDKTDPTWTPFMEFFTKVHGYYTPGSSNPVADGLYYSFVIGRVKFIMLDLRRMRDPQASADGPTKSVLGPNQKVWFKEQLLEAKTNVDIEGTFIISQILWTADRDNPNGDSFESWGASWGSYPTERAEIANYIYDNRIKNVAFICADVHMQAIDDGRNSCYITDINGDRVDPNTIEKDFWTPVLEASPFDQYISFEGGPFNTTDLEGSGGPTNSSENSYGVIEVLDIGENWLQVKMYTMALLGGVWTRNRFYTFNWNADSGQQSTPPPLDWTNEHLPNMNGYVFKGEWKPILNRYVFQGQEYKQQLMKWKFIGGVWKKVFDIQNPNQEEVLVIDQLNGWTLDTENALEITGKGFTDVSYPRNYGGYYTLASNAGDLFGNYPYGTTTGTPVYSTTEGVRSVSFTPGNYVTLPSAEGVGLLFNILYDRDFFMGVWVYLPAGQTLKSNVVTDVTETYGLYTENGNLKINLGPEALAEAPLSVGWNKIGLNVKISDSGKFTFLHINENTPIELLNFVVKDFGTVAATPVPMIFGFNSNTTMANFYFTPRYAEKSQINRYITKPTIEVILENDTTSYVIPEEWFTVLRNDKIGFTIPPTTPIGEFKIRVESLNYVSNTLPLIITSPTSLTQTFTTNFDTIKDIRDNFYILHRQWGGANGGVVKENVVHTPGLVKLFGNGDLYEGTIQGVTRDGAPKFHTHPDDPQLGQPWTNRVGACLVFKEKTGFGSYRVTATIPTKLGMCSAFWTFFYNEIYPGDPRWEEFLSEGLHQQGNLEDGFFMTRNHEIDIEFPSHLDGGILAEPSFNNMKCNTWVGELQNWDVPPTDPTYWEEYRDNLTPTGINMYAQQEHEFRFDWYPDRVEFYIDGVLKRTNTGNTVPNIAGHFTFGVWFPSAPLLAKPWLVRPDRAWAGGTVDTDGGRKAMFDRVSMNVSNFTFIPFDTTGLRVKGETYPFGGYRIKNDNNV